MITEVPKEEKAPRPFRVLAIVRGDTLSKVRDLATDEVPVWPALLKRELLMALTVTAGLLTWSLLVEAPLEQIANPTQTPNPAKAPWYFVGLQELLAYFDPWIAGVTLPCIIIFGLLAIPYLDPNREGTGEYAFSKRKFACSVFTLGLIMWFTLICIGELFRGPNWAWFWPWERWTTDRTSSGVTVNLPTWAGAVGFATYFAIGLTAPRVLLKRWVKSLGGVRYAVTMVLLLLMLVVPLKVLLRLLFNVKYLLATPWLNI